MFICRLASDWTLEDVMQRWCLLIYTEDRLNKKYDLMMA